MYPVTLTIDIGVGVLVHIPGVQPHQIEGDGGILGDAMQGQTVLFLGAGRQ